MRIFALIFACLFSYIAHAQVPITGAGLGKPTSGGVSFSITPEGTTGNSGSGASTTLGSWTYGSGCSTVLVAFTWGWTVAATITAATLDGSQALTPVSGSFGNNLFGSLSTQIFSITSPTGSSGTSTVTFSGAITNGVAAQAWCVNTNTPTPASAAFQCASNNCSGSGFSQASVSQSITIPSGGGVVGICSGGGPASYAFTNLTLDNNISFTGTFVTNQAGSGHATGGTGASVTVTCADTAADNAPWTLSLVAMSP